MANLADQFPIFLSNAYTLVRQIAHGGSAVVYEVFCIRGRLRGRCLAVKRVVPSDYEVPSVALHQALFHPNVITLHSVMKSVDYNYHVLELCSDGNLSDLISTRDPPSLFPNEVRQLVKHVGGALAYLKEERVVHRNICASNILLAKGFKLKIGGFLHAIQLPEGDDYVSQRLTSATHPAPEMLRSPYEHSFGVDVWALGCVINSCLEGIRDPDLDSSVECLPRALTENALSDLQDLLACLLTTSETERLDVNKILKHPYLVGDPSRGSLGQLLEREVSDVPSRFLRESSVKRRNPDRIVLKDIGNMKLREFISSKSKDTRRAVSDPTTVRTRTLCLSENDEEGVSIPKAPVPSTSGLGSSRKPFAKPAIIRDLPSKVDNISIPIGTTRPIAIDTHLLSPTTHKLVNGSITILPSLSLLVDFRENQRRQGLSGDEVLIIDAIGTTIKIFSAPHLSVPSCLVEPLRVFTIEELPSSYWRLYNDAAHFVDQIKQKTPQMTVYKYGAKCTMMSNMPLADIEIILYDSKSQADKSRARASRSKDQTPAMRIRYSRHSSSIELAQNFDGNRGIEWKKERRPCSDPNSLSSSDDLNELSRKGLDILCEFLQTCMHLERIVESTNSASAHIDANSELVRHLPPSLSSLKIPLRPRKYQGIPVAIKRNGSSELARGNATPVASQNTTYSAADVPDLFPHMRYIALVGWCIRWPTQEISNNSKYQIMFTDGACLEADFHNSCLVFLSSTGETIRCRISHRYSNVELEKRASSLKHFVRLYEGAVPPEPCDTCG